MTMFELGAALRDARIARGLKQDEVARLAAISRASLSRLENGTIGEFGIRKVMRVCDVLGLALEVNTEASRPTLQDLLRAQGRN